MMKPPAYVIKIIEDFPTSVMGYENHEEALMLHVKVI